jgi:hypothetical protein
MCDGNRGVIAKGISCAEAFWLADRARAGEQVAGWSVLGNSAGIVRLRHGTAWVKIRRVPRRPVAELMITGLYLEHVYPKAADGSVGFETLALCAAGRMESYEESSYRPPAPSPGPMMALSAATYARGSWKPARVFDWRGGRTLELDTVSSGGLESSGLALAGSQRIRLELRDDGSGTLRIAQGAWPVSWTRNARCKP